MAVNVGQRNVPDTPANRQLEACNVAMELAIHTIKICSNKNIFKVEYQDALTNDIISCANASKGNSYKPIQRMKQYYNDLWRNHDES